MSGRKIAVLIVDDYKTMLRIIRNLLKQIEPFGATFHFGQEVTKLDKRPDGRFALETSKGTRFITKTVFIAGGVGSFQPRLLRVEGIEKFEGNDVDVVVNDSKAGDNLSPIDGITVQTFNPPDLVTTQASAVFERKSGAASSGGCAAPAGRGAGCGAAVRRRHRRADAR